MSEHHTPPPPGSKKAAKIVVLIVLAIVAVIFVGYNVYHARDSSEAPATSSNPHSIDQPAAQ